MKQYINHQALHKQFDDYMKEKPCKNDKKNDKKQWCDRVNHWAQILS